MIADCMSLVQEVGTYLAAILAGMVELPAPQNADSKIHDPALASDIFSLLTSRAFCYLGRSKAEHYRDAVVASLRRRMATGGAFRFFYDIGPGYHATTRPGVLPLSFDVGLSELLILGQVNGLCRGFGELYARRAIIASSSTTSVPCAQTTSHSIARRVTRSSFAA